MTNNTCARCGATVPTVDLEVNHGICFACLGQSVDALCERIHNATEETVDDVFHFGMAELGEDPDLTVSTEPIDWNRTIRPRPTRPAAWNSRN